MNNIGSPDWGINIGQVLIKNRHKKGITQDELAEYIGVSKAAVSKWETSSTYPDITLLPYLAAFFDISIDELMGYEPQMNREDIRRLYRQLSDDFARKPFDEVMEYCRDITKKYFSCAPLLFQLGALLVNHCMLAKTPEKTAAVLEEAAGLFSRAREISDDMELSAQAVCMKALCMLQLGKTDEVFNLLEPLQTVQMNPEPLLASAFQITGKPKEGKKVLQAGIYNSLLALLNLLSSYMANCTDEPSVLIETGRRLMLIAETFNLKTLHPGMFLSLELSAAQGFCALNDKEQALNLLENYTELVLSDIYPLRLHGDSYFTLLDEWLDEYLALGSALPRDELIIRKSMADAVTANPAFESLKEEPRFQKLLHRLNVT